jgi:hypothetical protein
MHKDVFVQSSEISVFAVAEVEVGAVVAIEEGGGGVHVVGFGRRVGEAEGDGLGGVAVHEGVDVRFVIVEERTHSVAAVLHYLSNNCKV